MAGIVDQSMLDVCRRAIDEAFGAGASREREVPDGLVRRLTAATAMQRSGWPPSLLRSLWEAALQSRVESGLEVKRLAHEARWLSLLGFLLCGLAMAWRWTIGASLKRGGC